MLSILDGLRVRQSLSFAACQCVVSQVEIFGSVLENEHDDQNHEHCQKGNGGIEQKHRHFFRLRFLASEVQQTPRRRVLERACERLLCTGRLEFRDFLRMLACFLAFPWAFPSVQFHPKNIFFESIKIN